jgi:hypothetical protein
MSLGDFSKSIVHPSLSAFSLSLPFDSESISASILSLKLGTVIRGGNCSALGISGARLIRLGCTYGI